MVVHLMGFAYLQVIQPLMQERNWPSIFSTPESSPLQTIASPSNPLSNLDHLLFPSLEPIYECLPPPSVSAELLRMFYQEVYWFCPCFHWPSFLVECDQLYACRTDHDRSKIDPAWLALYLGVLSVSTALLTDDSYNHNRKTLANVPRVADGTASGMWFSACRVALMRADWIGKPQVRVLQVRRPADPT